MPHSYEQMLQYYFVDRLKTFNELYLEDVPAREYLLPSTASRARTFPYGNFSRSNVKNQL